MSLFLSFSFMNHFDHLPSEVISLILNLVDETCDLYTCALINKTFYKYATPLLWEHLDLNGHRTFSYLIDNLEASSSLRSNSLGEFVRSASIQDRLSDDELLAFIKHVPQLNDLSLHEATFITDDSFEHVPLYVPHLTRLYIRYSSITQLSIEAMSRHWYRQLNHLEFKRCTDLNYELFSALRQCTALTSLAISYCWLENYNAVDTMQDAARNVMALPNITSFCIMDPFSNWTPFLPITPTAQQLQQQEWRILPTLFPDDYFDNSPSTPITLQQQPIWPYLTHFFLGACRDLTDAMVLALIQSHPHLVDLGFYHSDMMTDKTLDAIATHLPNIVNVDMKNVTKITAAGIRRLIEQCPKLATVGCDWCNDGNIHPSDFDDVDPSSMEIGHTITGVSYVTRLYKFNLSITKVGTPIFSKRIDLFTFSVMLCA
ncbi:hypothetical protein BCR42DRAFT_496624 [Absidia repens]|uniref:F-box domain-containing protein n=1 Tax=Absidia repens TaxID=90262 RepID=A0A1X2HYW6_9FUNG|nr:hypothetical protein BCR42DRAFT_496624 [Absidia repens]